MHWDRYRPPEPRRSQQYFAPILHPLLHRLSTPGGADLKIPSRANPLCVYCHAWDHHYEDCPKARPEYQVYLASLKQQQSSSPTSSSRLSNVAKSICAPSISYSPATDTWTDRSPTRIDHGSYYPQDIVEDRYLHRSKSDGHYLPLGTSNNRCNSQNDD